MVGAPRSQSNVSPSTERRRVLFVVIGLSCFLGVMVSALLQRPANSAEAGDDSVVSSWRMLTSARKNADASGAKFRHILDEFDTDEHALDGGGQQAAVDASTLNDLQNELRRLKRPLRVLIHQLEPPNGPTTAPPPVAEASGAPHGSLVSDKGQPTDLVEAEAPNPPPPVMHRLVFHNKWPREQTIFVATIGRVTPGTSEQACARSVDAFFDRATAPSQLRVGVVEVYKDHTNFSALPPMGGCVNPKYAMCNQSSFCATDFIRVRRVHESEVVGEWDQLQLATSMYRNEAYILLTSSWQEANGPVVLPAGWDALYIHTLGQRRGGGTRKALTSWLPRLPSNATAGQQDASSWFPCGVVAKGHATWDVSMGNASTASAEAASLDMTAVRSHLVAADMLFAPGRLLVDVPIDPMAHTEPAITFSLALSLRMFNAGYHSFVVGPQLQPACMVESSAEPTRCILRSRRNVDADDVHLNEVLSRGWDDPHNSTALEPRFSVGSKALRSFWKAVGFSNGGPPRDGEVGSQCTRI